MKISRAMLAKIRPVNEISTRKVGDFVFFWRDDGWEGPGRIVGGHRDVVLIEYNMTVIRIHPLKVKNALELQNRIGSNLDYNVPEKEQGTELDELPMLEKKRVYFEDIPGFDNTKVFDEATGEWKTFETVQHGNEFADTESNSGNYREYDTSVKVTKYKEELISNDQIQSVKGDRIPLVAKCNVFGETRYGHLLIKTMDAGNRECEFTQEEIDSDPEVY